MAIILAVNAGSSSVKVSVFKAAESGDKPSERTKDGSSSSSPPTQLAEIQISGLTSPPAKLDFTRGSKRIKGQEIEDTESPISNQSDAFEYILNQIEADAELASTASRKHITHVCHRVVHGGSFSHAQEITADTLSELERLTDLAPLHNGAALDIVRKAASRGSGDQSDDGKGGSQLPEARHIAVFDSSFHQSMPPHVSTYAISAEAAKQNGLHRYGFHGISYSYITRAVTKYLDIPLSSNESNDSNDSSSSSNDKGNSKRTQGPNLIALHLGSGASACAIKNGQSYDTSMGLTPLSGLPGATRSGDIDPALVFHLTHNAGKQSSNASSHLHVTKAEELLNTKAGWKALTGTADFGQISANSDNDDDEGRKCKLAFDLLVDRIVGFVGSYYLKLDGQVDALVFAGGIGEKGAKLRRAIVGKCRAIGFEIDGEKNEGEDDADAEVRSISKKGTSKHEILVVKTDEQFEMARTVVADSKLFTK